MDFEAPSGPPPPKVPDGWIVKWNEQYKEWSVRARRPLPALQQLTPPAPGHRFYVNRYTKKSQWEKPTEPARAPGSDDSPDGPPPYAAGKSPAPSDAKTGGSTNPFDHRAGAGSSQEDADARLARQLQEEEDARAARGHTAGGAASSYASTPVPGSSSYPDQLPTRPDSSGGGSRGLLGKLFGKNKTQAQGGYGGGYPGQQPQYGAQPAYGAQPQYGAYPHQGGYGGYPPQGGYGGGYGGGPGYGGPPPGGYYGGGGGYQQPQQQQAGRTGGGLGMGGLALGAGAGLLGGVLIGEAIENHDQSEYNQGYR